MAIEISYVPTSTGNPSMDANFNDVATALNAIRIAIAELQKKAGIE
jgi:hypothetical protein